MRRIVTVAWALAVGVVFLPRAGAAQGYSQAPGEPESKQVEALQDRIQTQPEMMEAIRALQADPAFQDVLNDPEITSALESGNLAVLLTNPKINTLMSHPTVQDITKKLGE